MRCSNDIKILGIETSCDDCEPSDYSCWTFVSTRSDLHMFWVIVLRVPTRHVPGRSNLDWGRFYGHVSYIHTRTHTYMRACIHSHIHTYIHTYMHACIHTYVHTLHHIYITFTSHYIT